MSLENMSLQMSYSQLKLMASEMPSPYLSVYREDGVLKPRMSPDNQSYPEAIPMELLVKQVDNHQKEFGKGNTVPTIRIEENGEDASSMLPFHILWPTEKVAETAEDSVGC